MEDNLDKIKLIYNKEEKFLSPIPETFNEFVKNFKNIFGLNDSNSTYSFEYLNMDISISINQNSYEDEIQHIKEMENPTIFVEEEKDNFNLLNSNGELAVSLYNPNSNEENVENNNDEVSNSLLNLSESLRNMHVYKKKENEKNIKQFEEELSIMKSKLSKEIENTKKLEEILENISKAEDQSKKIENLEKEVDKYKKENSKNIQIKKEEEKKNSQEILNKNKELIQNINIKYNEIK